MTDAGPAAPLGTSSPPAPDRAARVGTPVRVVLAIYAATLGITGVWAAAFPRSFYDDFPGLGRVWVAVDGPYNEHLVRDVGTLNLALATLVAVAALWATSRLVALAAAVSLVNAIPHLAYHLVNLGVYDATDKAANAVSLGLAVAVPAAVLWSAGRSVRHGSPA